MEIARSGSVGLWVVLALLVAGCAIEVPKADESSEGAAGSGAGAASIVDSDAGLNGGAPSGVNRAGSTSTTVGRDAGEEASCDEDDSCEVGEAACVEGEVRLCETGARGCNVWSAPTRCATGTCSSSTQCLRCVDECVIGTSECSDGRLRICEEDTTGCAIWGTPVTCEPAECTTATSCAACSGECAAGTTECSDGQERTCVADELGCPAWSEQTACDSGTCASAEACAECAHECAAGATDCQSGELRVCEEDEQGCRTWGTPSLCTTGTCDGAMACAQCDEECTPSETLCADGELQICIADPLTGCFAWGDATTCGTGACATTAACYECNNECATNDTHCSSGVLEVCEVDTGTGCRAWGSPSVCQSGSCESTTACAAFDPCENDTCQNGATCEADGDQYACACAPGFSGSKCDTNIDDCAGSPCKNGGACVDQVAGYACVCGGAFTGPDCSLPRFELLPSDFDGLHLSGDGRVVIGSVDLNAAVYVGGQGSGLASLTGETASGANDLSSDGSTIVGYSSHVVSGETVSRAVRWRNVTALELPKPSGATSCRATGVSADGGTTVGSCTADTRSTIVRWQGTTVGELGTPSGQDSCFDPVISGDASTIFFTCSQAGDRLLFVWTAQAGMVGLTLPSTNCRLYDTTDDGILGVGACGQGSVARGTSYTGSTGTYVPASWLLESDALWFPLRAISADGQWIIGDTEQAVSTVAVRWNAAREPDKISDLLAEVGASGDEQKLVEGRGISDDGQTILGSSWLVRLD